MIKLTHVTANGYHSTIVWWGSIIYQLKEQFTGQDNTVLGSSKTLHKLDIA
jgi:hypothetical protein